MAAKTVSAEKKAPKQQPAAVVPPGDQRKPRTLSQKLFRGGLFSFLALLLLFFLAAGIFYGLAKMKIVDPDEQARQLGWQDNRLVKTALEKLQDPQKPEIIVKPDKEEPATVQPQLPNMQQGSGLLPAGGVQSAASAATVKPIDTTERDRLEKLRLQEEKKRVSKLARLYEGMKPAEAVAILEKLDDDTVVAVLNRMEEENAAKILAAFDASRAAGLSEIMLRNRPNQMIIPQQNQN